MWESGAQKRMEPPTTLSNPPKLFLSSNLTIAQLICFFAGSLRAVVGEVRGSQKLARDFTLGGVVRMKNHSRGFNVCRVTSTAADGRTE
jgi:hypothetical protein